jgi:hypothetical protein
MSTRIRELEDALRQAHSEDFDQPHPLLAGSITVIPQGSVPETSPSLGESGAPFAAATTTETETVIDAFGVWVYIALYGIELSRPRNTHDWNPWRNHLHEQHRPLGSKTPCPLHA